MDLSNFPQWRGFTFIPLAAARNHLSDLIRITEETHQRFVITKHGAPSVILVAAADLRDLEQQIETLTREVAQSNEQTAVIDNSSPRSPVEITTQQLLTWLTKQVRDRLAEER